MEIEVVNVTEKEYDADAEKVNSLQELEVLRLKYLGKKGLVA